MLTKQEKKLAIALGECWNMFCELPEEHPMECKEFCGVIHQAQAIVLCRPGARELRGQDQLSLEEWLYRYGYARTIARAVANVYYTKGMEEALRVIVDWDDTKYDYTGELRKAIKQWENER